MQSHDQNGEIPPKAPYEAGAIPTKNTERSQNIFERHETIDDNPHSISLV